MKSIIVGDVHFGASLAFGHLGELGINSRLIDYENTLGKIIDHAIGNEIESFIFLGDIFEIRNPTPIQVSVFYRQLMRLSNANIETHIIPGNHDLIKSRTTTSTLEPLLQLSLPNVFIHNNIETILIKSKKEPNDAFNAVFVPYRNRQCYDRENNEDALKDMRDELRKAIDDIDKNFQSIAISHMMMEDTLPSDAGDYGLNELILPFEMFKGVDITINGHIHKSSIQKREPLFIYSGSMECKDFSEKDHKKIYIIYDTSKSIKDSITFKPISTRKFVDFEIDYSNDGVDEFMNDILMKLEKINLKDSVVRMNIKIPELKVPLINTTIVRTKLNEMGVSCISDISITPIISRQQRNKEVNDAPDDITAFKNYISSQMDVSDDVLTLGLEIMKDRDTNQWIR